MRTGSWTWLAVLVGAIALGAAQVAKAGPIEELAAIAMHPKDPNVMLLRYQYGGGGILYTADGGASWKLMCGSMIGPGEKVEGPIVLAGDGRTLVGVFKGLWQGQNGCSWSQAPELAGIRVSDVSNHPTDPDVSFAVTGVGTDGATNGMLRRDASGTWTEFGSRDAGIISRVRATQMTDSGLRYYQSAQRGMRDTPTGAQVPNYMIRVSDDGGNTWTENPIEVDEGTMRLEAIDPIKPDRILISIDRTNPPDALLVSDDQGKTFNEYLTLTDLGGLTFAPDGRLWIGDFGNPSSPSAPKGIWTAPNLGAPATLLTGEYPVACLAYQPANETLFACKRWELGTIDKANGGFTHLFGFLTQSEFVTCEGVDAPTMCKAQLCNDYCGPLHFSKAPLCTAYNEPNCGPTADGDLDSSTGGSGGTGATGGTSGTSGALAGSMSVAPTAGTKAAEPKSGGCATSTSGPFSAPAGQVAFLALCTAVLFRRYRRQATDLA
jgi:hypothetical protein